MNLNLVDSHCHLEMLDLSEFDHQMDNVILKAQQQQVSEILSVAVDLESFAQLLATAKKYPGVYASLGLHPCHSPERIIDIASLVRLADDDKVIAIGETGLDYHMNHGQDPLAEDFAWQKTRFRQHIQAAIACSKPLIIHTRNAAQDTIAILEQEQANKVGGIMHCFVEDWATAEKALALGFYISFSGIVTFNSAKSLQEVARRVPDERLLIETDSPYLAPVPMRGKSNQPAYVAYIAEFLAQLRGVSVEHIARVTRANFEHLFKPGL